MSLTFDRLFFAWTFVAGHSSFYIFFIFKGEIAKQVTDKLCHVAEMQPRVMYKANWTDRFFNHTRTPSEAIFLSFPLWAVLST